MLQILSLSSIPFHRRTSFTLHAFFVLFDRFRPLARYLFISFFQAIPVFRITFYSELLFIKAIRQPEYIDRSNPTEYACITIERTLRWEQRNTIERKRKRRNGREKKARRNEIDNKGQGRKMNKKTRTEKTLQSMKSLAWWTHYLRFSQWRVTRGNNSQRKARSWKKRQTVLQHGGI